MPAWSFLHTFHSYRSPVVARRGMAASSQPLASLAGLNILQAGGTAADAAVAMAAVLNVTEPTSTGIGGDCFALYYEANRRALTALNGSGRAPAALTIDQVKRDLALPDHATEFTETHRFHAHTITVPGACAGWADLLVRHGVMALAETLAPAIDLAERGFPVAPLTAHFWAQGAARVDPALRMPSGQAPRPGEVFRNPDLARTFRLVAEGGPQAFYTGPLAERIVARAQAAGSVLTLADLAAHTSTWETPLSADFGGAQVWECPPNGQGLAALLALNILREVDLAGCAPLSVDRWHWLIEALRLAFAEARWYVADPQFNPAPLADLLSARFAAAQRARIHPTQAMPNPARGAPFAASGTVYCCAVDSAGNACSFINSNYMGFGTGFVPPGAGFTLQNRGHNFSLDPAHPNALAPGKRPYHTIIPAMLTRQGDLLGPFGVMGGFMQPQGHVQVAVALLTDGLHPQAALDRLRFCLEPETGAVALEEGLPADLVAGLAERGHPLRPGVGGLARAQFGRGQIIWRDEAGTLWGGSDPRADGLALGF